MLRSILDLIFSFWEFCLDSIGRTASSILLVSLIFLSLFLGSSIFTEKVSGDLEIYFLDVGQGDSQLIRSKEGIDILIDGGPPNRRALEELIRILGPRDRYIDIVVLTHPQLDHFGGLIDVLRFYRVGAFVYPKYPGSSNALSELEELINEDRILHLSLDEGDRISRGSLVFRILLPDFKTIESNNANDASIVGLLEKDGFRALFTGDIGQKVERRLLGNFSSEIDLLKVPHHGSKFSSTHEFLRSLSPEISVIQVGSNSYGHPTEEVLGRLEDVGSQVFRTDLNGTLKVTPKGSFVEVFSSN